MYARNFGKGQWSFIGPGSETKWYSMIEDSPQGIWDNRAEKMLIEFAESGCPIFRATTPLSRGQLKSKGHGNLSIHFAAVQETIETIFRIIVSANQLSLYGAVAEMREEYDTLHDTSGRPDKVMGQSIVLSEIKIEVPLESDDPAYQNFLFQQYEERIEKLSQHDKLSKILCGCRISECCGEWTVFHDERHWRFDKLLKRTDRGDQIKAQIYLEPPIITSMSNSWRASLQQIIQNWMMTVLGLLKSGKLRLRHTIDQGDLIKLLGEWYEKFDLVTKKFFSTEQRNP